MSETMPLALAIETSTASCSVAIGNQQSCQQLVEQGVNIHSQVLLGMVEQLLEQYSVQLVDLSFIAVGSGPGSFTGLRIGIGVAQGLAWGVDRPMVAVSSLAALAQQAATSNPDAKTILVGIDARMEEIYFARYVIGDGVPIANGDIQLLTPEQLSATADDVILAGNTWSVYWPRFNDSIKILSPPIASCRQPQAAALLKLAWIKYRHDEVIEPCAFQADYVRNNVAKKRGF